MHEKTGSYNFPFYVWMNLNGYYTDNLTLKQQGVTKAILIGVYFMTSSWLEYGFCRKETEYCKFDYCFTLQTGKRLKTNKMQKL